jgi:nucleotidyltransferase substrate binding protein (TIGR01987 family)
MTEDIRWKQRFSNYTKAFQSLTEAVDLSLERELSALEQQGLIQSFEFTHELAWKVLKDYLEYQAVVESILNQFYPALKQLAQKFGDLAH